VVSGLIGGSSSKKDGGGPANVGLVGSPNSGGWRFSAVERSLLSQLPVVHQKLNQKK
jgi:hypothetical protein